MKKFVSAAATAAFAFASLFALPACGGQRFTSEKYEYYSLGTFAKLVVTADFSSADTSARFDLLVSQTGDLLNRLESSLSSDGENSYISRFNAAPAGARIEVDELTYEVLNGALDMHEFTDGYYNPAVYYSVDLFGFSTRFSVYGHTADISTRRPYDRTASYVDESTGEEVEYVTAMTEPDEFYVAAFSELASHVSEVRTEQSDGTYYVVKPDCSVEGLYGEQYTLALDLGGYAKGYAADCVSELMLACGFEYGYFNFGSSSFSVLRSRETQDGNWTMRLNNPDGLDPYATIYISSAGLSTSGDYERYYFTGEGKRYCHIIDPFTGRPVSSGIAACTVGGGSAAGADALTTALSVMGERRAAAFVNERLRKNQVVMIVRGEDGRCNRVLTNVSGLEYNPQYILAGSADGQGGIVIG